MSSIREKYNNLSPALKASVWFVLCNSIQKATQILTTPIYSRILTGTQFGEYKVFLSWVEFVAILATLDIFYSGYNVGMEKFREDRQRYTSAMHGLCFTITSLWVILLLPFASVIAPKIKLSSLQFRMLLLYMFVFPIFQFWSARKRYDYQYKSLILVTTIMSVLTIGVGTFVAILMDEKSNGVILVKILVEAVIGIPLLIASVKEIKSLYNKFYWKYALKFNIPLMPHYLSTMILNHSDVLMIDLICGKSEAGIYSVAYSVAMLMTIIQNAINSAIVPWLYRKLRTREFSGIVRVTTGVITLIAALNLVLLLVAPEAVAIMGSSDFADAVYVVPPITFGVFLTAVYGVFVNVEFYYHYNKFAAVASVLAAASNIGLNALFIPRFGFVAAGYTTFASYLLLTIMHFFGLNNATRKNDISYKNIISLKQIVLIIMGFTMAIVAIIAAYEYVLIRYAVIGVLILVSIICRKYIVSRIKDILAEKTRKEVKDEG